MKHKKANFAAKYPIFYEAQQNIENKIQDMKI